VNEVCWDTSLRQNDWKDNSISESNSNCKGKRNDKSNSNGISQFFPFDGAQGQIDKCGCLGGYIRWSQRRMARARTVWVGLEKPEQGKTALEQM
jgi:hypothetical protein